MKSETKIWVIQFSLLIVTLFLLAIFQDIPDVEYLRAYAIVGIVIAFIGAAFTYDKTMLLYNTRLLLTGLSFVSFILVLMAVMLGGNVIKPTMITAVLLMSALVLRLEE